MARSVRGHWEFSQGERGAAASDSSAHVSDDDTPKQVPDMSVIASSNRAGLWQSSRKKVSAVLGLLHVFLSPG